MHYTISELMHVFTRVPFTIKRHTKLFQRHRFIMSIDATTITPSVIEHVTRSVFHTLASAFSSAAADPKLSSSAEDNAKTTMPMLSHVLPSGMSEHVQPQFREAVINLYASEVGAYIGQGSWLSRTEALGGVWSRTNKQQMDQLASLWKTNGCKLPTGSTTTSFAQSFDPFPHVRSAADVAAFCSSASQADILLLYKTKGQLCEEALITRFASSHAQRIMCRHASVMWKSDTDTAAPKSMSVRPPGPLTDPGLYTITGT